MTNQNTFSRFPIGIPKVNEVPCVIPFRFDFSGLAPVVSQPVDMSLIFETRQISAIRTIYIDNSAGFSPVSVIFDIIGLKITCPGMSQGYFPVAVPSSVPKFNIVGALGGGAGVVAIYNMELQAAQWASERRDNYLVGASVVPANFAGEHFNRNWMADKTIVGNKTTAGSTTILNPTVGNGIFVTSIFVGISGNASIAVAAENQITVSLGAMQLLDVRPSLPAAPGATFGALILFSQSRLGINSNAFGDTLSIFMQTALATGHLTYAIGCGLTSIASIN